MYTPAKEYMQLSKKDRQQHLDLNENCIEIGGHSTQFKGILAHYLNVTIENNRRILLCHACHNEKCSNPKHLYFGTHKENLDDTKENGTYKSIWEKMVEKYGESEARRMQGLGNKSAGGKANKGKKKSEEHKRKISESLKNKKRL